MKKIINSFLVLFVAFTLTLSILSTREARAGVVNCIGNPFFESRVKAYFDCVCHENPSQYVLCETEYGCQTTCTPRYCDE